MTSPTDTQLVLKSVKCPTRRTLTTYRLTGLMHADSADPATRNLAQMVLQMSQCLIDLRTLAGLSGN
jgi:hypothetical protein